MEAQVIGPLSKSMTNDSNLPPGCTNADIERAFGDRYISPLEDAILDVLERFKVPTNINDRILDILTDWLEPPEEPFDDEPRSTFEPFDEEYI